jgi:hypothetical protein
LKFSGIALGVGTPSTRALARESGRGAFLIVRTLAMLVDCLSVHAPPPSGLPSWELKPMEGYSKSTKERNRVFALLL